MAQTQEEYTKKIGQLRTRLVGDLDLKQLEQMQLHIDLLERAAELANEDHSHDTSEHHDHSHSARLEKA